MHTSFTIRPMRQTDLPAILEIQELCYTEIAPESAVSLSAKQVASPATCYVTCQDDRAIGYLISLPWRFESPPELNAEISELPIHPDTLYLHDLAVSPKMRGAGAGKALVAKFIALVTESKLKRASLIAVQNSAAFWQQYSFRRVDRISTSIQKKLSSYGENVQYMERLSSANRKCI